MMTLEQAFERVGWAPLTPTVYMPDVGRETGMMGLDEAYERVGWAQLGQTYIHHETAGLGSMLQPIVAEALADEGVSAQLSLLMADTLRSPAVDSALNRIGLRLAAWTAGGIAVGLLAGYYLRQRF